MFDVIYNKIKEYNSIVIARHIGVDPDAMASQIALKLAILETWPEKKVLAVGQGSSKFTYLGTLDKQENIDYENTLLIITDTPDKKRVDIENIDNYPFKIKIDHHPFVEKFCDIEYIDDKNSSACQILLEFLYSTEMKRNKKIVEILFQGIISDTNRFMFSNSNAQTFYMVARIIEEYNLDLPLLYEPLYLRPLKEIRLQGFIEENMQVSTHGVASIVLTKEILSHYNVDSSAAGNMINNFNYIEDVLVWLTVSEDVKNDVIKVSIRSRGPVINEIAERFHGGGHEKASGARLVSLEEVPYLVAALDEACEVFQKKDV